MKHSENVINFISDFRYRDKQFAMDYYQRNYCWGKEQWNALWDSIQLIIKTGCHKEYYFSQIIIENSNKDDNIYIVDGQQRLTTLSLLFKAMYDISTNEDIKQQLSDLLYNEDGKIRICATRRDKDAYNNILRGDKSLTKGEKKINMYKAYKFFKDKIIDEDIAKIFKAIKQLEVLIGECESKEEAEQVFVTINTNGLKMSDNEVIRQCTYKKAQEFSTCKSYDAEDIIDKVETIRDFEHSLDTQSKKLFYYAFLFYMKVCPKDIKSTKEEYNKWICKPKTLEEYKLCLTHIKEFIRYWEGYISSNKEVKDKLMYFFKGCIDSNSFKCAIIGAMFNENKYTPDEQLEILKGAEWIEVRRAVIRGTEGGKVNLITDYIKEIEKIKENNPNTPIKEVIKSAIEKATTQATHSIKCGNKELGEKFVNKNFYTGSIGKTILHRITYTNPTISTPNLKELTIEHVLNQRNNKNNDLLHTIGNLTLLTPTGNKKAGTKPFEKKKEVYKESNLPLNNYFENFNTWGDTEIMERSEHIKEDFIRIYGE